MTLLVVCDGHGTYGHNISSMFVELLPNHIAQNFEGDAVRQAVEIGFVAAENELIQRLPDMLSFSGTTCTLVLIYNQVVICANCGDSRAVCGRLLDSDRGKWAAMPLSTDHKPNIPEER
jgi:serine/threonine protein phosphatase PrpC